MGTTAAFNIHIKDIDHDEAQKLIERIREEFSFERMGDMNYKFEVIDKHDSGQMNLSNDSISLIYSKQGFSEYEGCMDPGLLVHYSPYYSEEMETLSIKINMLNEIKSILEEEMNKLNINKDIEYYCAACTI